MLWHAFTGVSSSYINNKVQSVILLLAFSAFKLLRAVQLASD